MIEVVFRGRLGNQLFQHAYASSLAARLGCRLNADFSWYLRAPESFDLWRFGKTGYRPLTAASEITSRIAEKLRFLRPMAEYEMYEPRFDPDALKVGDRTRLNGWFQSVRYFEDQAARIREIFDLTEFAPVDEMRRLRAQAGRRPMVAMHVRRGDYVGNPHFFLDDYDAYYRLALEDQRAALGEEPFLVVVSDDPQWCRQWPLLNGLNHQVFETPDPTDPLTDLALMAGCDHNIITNSSFSWWAAWLGDPAGRRVVMPRRWLPTRSTDECGMDVPGWI